MTAISEKELLGKVESFLLSPPTVSQEEVGKTCEFCKFAEERVGKNSEKTYGYCQRMKVPGFRAIPFCSVFLWREAIKTISKE